MSERGDEAMDKKELKQRIDRADERAINLFKKYPIVGTIVLLVGFVLGVIVGGLIWS